jgi:hypothetical protein
LLADLLACSNSGLNWLSGMLFGFVIGVLQTVFVSIRGPGTVGIDSSGDIEEVYGTIVEALDFYGLYSITRCPAASLPLSLSEDPSPEEYMSSMSTGAALEMNVYGNGGSGGDELESLLDDQNALYLACGFVGDEVTANNDHNDQSDSGAKRRKHSHIISGGGKPSMRRQSTVRGRDSLLVVSQTPMASSQEIQSRRVSMGIYGLYTKSME